MIVAPVLARDLITYLHFRSVTELAPAKICLHSSNKAIGHSRRWRTESPAAKAGICIQQSWIQRKEKEMFSLFATLVALVCFSASVAMFYTDGEDCLYPPRFE
jgi:hypothetical protein